MAKKSKIEIDIEEILKDKIYETVMGEYWDKIENLRKDIEEDVKKSAEGVAERIAKLTIHQVREAMKNEKQET